MTQRAAHGQQLPKLCTAQERAGRLGRWDSHQGLRPEAQISRVPPQMAVSLMAKQPAVLAPGASSLWWTRFSPAGRRGDPSPNRKHTPAHTTHILRGLTRHMRQSPFPASGQSPARGGTGCSSVRPSPRKSLAQAEGRTEASFESRPCTVSAVDCGGQRSRIPGRRWAWS